jgi:hypothetical protein
VDPQPRGPDWMQITPKAGFLFHAYSHKCAGDRAGGLATAKVSRVPPYVISNPIRLTAHRARIGWVKRRFPLQLRSRSPVLVLGHPPLVDKPNAWYPTDRSAKGGKRSFAQAA